MLDINPLSPRYDSPAAIAEALARCVTAGRGALAEVERLKSERAALLMAGHPAQWQFNLAALTTAMADATAPGKLIGLLQKRLSGAGSPEAAQADPAAKIAEVAAALAAWWSEHGAVVLGGLHQLRTAAIALAAAAHAAPPAPGATNVPELRPKPAA